MPESAVRISLLRCLDRLDSTLALARVAAGGPDPACGAEYLLDGLDDLSSDLRQLTVSARL